VPPVLNKVGQFLMAPPLRHIVGQVRPKLDFTAIMDNSCIFIAHLAKGRIGEHNSMLLGSLLMTKFFLAALRRQDRPEDERIDFFITADELHNLASDMLAAILSEARKYHLSITGAFQYLNSVSPNIRSAILGTRVPSPTSALSEHGFAEQRRKVVGRHAVRPEL
jgi:hypothetical protein